MGILHHFPMAHSIRCFVKMSRFRDISNAWTGLGPLALEKYSSNFLLCVDLPLRSSPRRFLRNQPSGSCRLHTESPRKTWIPKLKKNFQHFLGMRWILDGCLTHDMSLFGGSVKAPISQAPHPFWFNGPSGPRKRRRGRAALNPRWVSPVKSARFWVSLRWYANGSKAGPSFALKS